MTHHPLDWVINVDCSLFHWPHAPTDIIDTVAQDHPSSVMWYNKVNICCWLSRLKCTTIVLPPVWVQIQDSNITSVTDSNSNFPFCRRKSAFAIRLKLSTAVIFSCLVWDLAIVHENIQHVSTCCIFLEGDKEKLRRKSACSVYCIQRELVSRLPIN